MIDTHLHLWDTRRLSYPWLADDPRLNRPVTEAELDVRTADGRRVVLVEAGAATAHALAEAEWLSRLAQEHAGVHGFVAAVDLTDSDLGHALDHLQALPGLVGVRHLLQDTDLLTTRRADLVAGLDELHRRGLPFDACVRAPQLAELAALLADTAGGTVVLDHMGKPPVGDPDDLDRWRGDLEALAGLPQVVCKLSGLPAECWSPMELDAAFEPVVGHALDCFGPQRCVVGSDWPVSDPGFDWCGRVVEFVPPPHRDAVAETTALSIYRRLG
ncbi:MAG TPA: amidohydrolase family protein [Propionibacteriaceae bacterium]|nr:amidohydrolase family protein [Propionibacteriaceae bacterium]